MASEDREQALLARYYLDDGGKSDPGEQFPGGLALGLSRLRRRNGT